ncbi:MAG: hypothetical protein Q6373_017420 [Candidatus Sigynarchaeota archaeon]
MKMQFIYESQAFFAGFKHGIGFPLEGMERIAAIAHKHNIPVSWLTNAQGAESGADKFTEFHDRYGDDVSLWLMPYAQYKKDQYKIVMGWKKDQIRAFVRNELDRAKAALPWAKWDTCGFFFRNNDVIQVLAEFGFIAVYGACWYQFNTDSVDDVGIPYGCYYMDPSNFKRPARIPCSSDFNGLNAPLISNEWLTHDINKVSNYKKTASIFSTDPNDVNNNGICYPGENHYWYQFFLQHYRNSTYNAFYPFIFHQESHEMLNTPAFQIYPQNKIDETAAIMEDFLAFVKNPDHHFDVEFTTIPAAMRKYRHMFPTTPAMLCVFDDVEIATERFQNKRLLELNKHKWDERKINKARGANRTRGLIGGPFPPTLVYYDLDCQLFFHKPQSWPVEIRNYQRKEVQTIKNLTRNSDIFKEVKFPLPIWTMPSDREIQIKIDPKPPKTEEFPYGIVLWNPDCLFDGINYYKWKEMTRKLDNVNSRPSINEHPTLIQEMFIIEGPIENLRLSWFSDHVPNQIGGENTILLKTHLTDKPIMIKIKPRT